jgi:glucose/arabinose dehydrogenase
MTSRITIAALAAAGLAVAVSAHAQTPPPAPSWTPPAPGQPVESRPANAKAQTPAFPRQTRAPYHPSGVAFETKTVVDGLEHPWGLAFLPDGRMLVTEKAGRLRVVTDGKLSVPVGGLPSVDARQGGGLMDVGVDPDFAQNSQVYWCYSEPLGDGSSATVARARLAKSGAANRLEDLKIVFRSVPTTDSVRSFGCRIAFARDKSLFIAMGDRDFDQFRPLVQRLDTDIGKVVRINRDGSIPRDNPYLKTPGARPELWAVGVRNVLGAAIDPATGDLWTHENGPRGGDELNRVQGGKNYGWPVISYGEEYSGAAIDGGATQKEGMEQPVYYWDPVIAPSGMAFYDGDLFPAWKGSLFVGSLRERRLERLELKDGRVVGEEPLLYDGGERIRDVRQGQDGALYLLTDDARGRIVRLAPK